MMIRRASITALGYVVVLALPLACTSAETSPATSSSSTAASATASAASAGAASASGAPSGLPRPERRGHGGQGPSGTMFREARSLELSDAQKATLDRLEAERESAEAPTDEGKDLQADTVAGIRAGKLDRARLQGDFAAIDKGAAARQAREEVALSGLHAALDEAQRKALVAAIRAKQPARDAHADAHADADAGTTEWLKRRLERLTSLLGLDPAQQKTAEGILAKWDSSSPAAMRAMSDEGRKRMEAVLTAFEGSSFDPKKLDLNGAPGKTAHEGQERDTNLLAQLLPILTPEQREKLAAQREHSEMHGHRGIHGPGPAGAAPAGSADPGAPKSAD